MHNIFINPLLTLKELWKLSPFPFSCLHFLITLPFSSYFLSSSVISSSVHQFSSACSRWIVIIGIIIIIIIIIIYKQLKRCNFSFDRTDAQKARESKLNLFVRRSSFLDPRSSILVRREISSFFPKFPQFRIALWRSKKVFPCQISSVGGAYPSGSSRDEFEMNPGRLFSSAITWKANSSLSGMKLRSNRFFHLSSVTFPVPMNLPRFLPRFLPLRGDLSQTAWIELMTWIDDMDWVDDRKEKEILFVGINDNFFSKWANSVNEKISF